MLFFAAFILRLQSGSGTAVVSRQLQDCGQSCDTNPCMYSGQCYLNDVSSSAAWYDTALSRALIPSCCFIDMGD